MSKHLKERSGKRELYVYVCVIKLFLINCFSFHTEKLQFPKTPGVITNMKIIDKQLLDILLFFDV